MKTAIKLFLIALVGLSLSCSHKKEEKTKSADSTQVVSKVEKQPFGKLPDGKEVYQYTMQNDNGIIVKVINYGGIITSIITPDKNGMKEDIVLGYDSLKEYLKSTNYFGAIVGRYGNRIANGKFTLNGKEYTLAKNNGEQHLHGGIKGFDKVYWNIEEVPASDGSALKLTYKSKDMEEGYPGNLTVEVLYTLTSNNELQIAYNATTDKPTVINLTQHTYFNLTGNTKRDILDHELLLRSDEIVAVDKNLIPTGKMMNVKGTPFDFNTSTNVGSRIADKNQQLQLGNGYDHCWVLSSKDTLNPVAVVSEPVSGRSIEMYTTEPGVQFYTGNFLNGTEKGKGGVVYKQRFGLCLETEHYPDSPNQPKFPTVVLNPGEEYHTETIYTFSAKL